MSNSTVSSISTYIQLHNPGKLATEKVERGADGDVDAAAGDLLQGADVVIGMDAAGISDRKRGIALAIDVLAEDREQRLVRTRGLTLYVYRMNEILGAVLFELLKKRCRKLRPGKLLPAVSYDIVVIALLTAA